MSLPSRFLRFSTRPAFHVLVILLLTFIAYSNSFHASFHFDDITNIVKNPAMQDPTYFTDHAKVIMLNRELSFSARSVGFITFFLNYAVNGPNPFGFHIVNFIIHMATVVLLYMLVLFLFKTPFLENSSLSEHAKTIAFLSALIFAVHPIQSQAVTYIVQRFASLEAFFYLLSITSYMSFRLLRKGKRTALFYVLCIVSAILAMKTKQNAFTLPLAIALVEFLFFSGSAKKRILYLIPPAITMLIIPLSMYHYGAGFHMAFSRLQSQRIPQYVSMTHGSYSLTEFRALATYLRLIILPVNQTFDYDYPVYHSLLNVPVTVSALLLAAVMAAAVYMLIRSRRQIAELRIVSFGIFWFFLTLSVESTLVVLQPIFEHRMYLPMAGIAPAAVTLCFVAASRKGSFRRTTTAWLLIAVALCALTFTRNRVWANEASFWQDVVEKAPDAARGHVDLGRAYFIQGKFQKALEQFKAALSIEPNHAMAHYNMALTLEAMGRPDEALKQYQAAIANKTDYVDAYINAGALSTSTGKIDDANKYYNRALELAPNNAKAHLGMGSLLASIGRYTEAVKYYKRAEELNPGLPETYVNLGLAYLAMGDKQQARSAFERATQLAPGDRQARMFLEYIDKQQTPGSH